jgi:hypothetical protein
MSEPVILTPEELKARKRRNLWLAWSIVAFVLLVFAITVSKMQALSLLGISQ